MRATRFIMLVIALVLPSGSPGAAEPLERAAIVQLQGTITVATDGGVVELELATPVAAPLQPAIEGRLRALRFEPVLIGGEPARARTGFTLDVAMFDLPGGGIRLTFDGISFHLPPGETAVRADGERLPPVPSNMLPPRYPTDLLRMGRSGAVDVALRIGDDGKVAEATVVRSYILGDTLRDPAARQTLRVFEAAVLAQSRTWRFDMPATRAAGDARARTCFTSVTFEADRVSLAPGKWVRVARGPKRAVPWLADGAADVAVPWRGTAVATSVFRLAAPLEPVALPQDAPVM